MPGPQGDVDVLIRILQHFNLTYDSCYDPEMLARPDLLFCEYRVTQNYTIPRTPEEAPLPVAVVEPSFFKAKPFRLQTIISLHGRIITPDGVRLKTQLKWPSILKDVDMWSSVVLMCHKIFAERLIHLHRADMMLELHAGKVPELTDELKVPYEWKYRDSKKSRFEDPFVAGSRPQ